ncbi:MAG: hypothetical protein KatS3mg124_0541 [Porticoccaceae bacterium]|nr:MAG: hypothetical protein KatS3mg124_0541 [Porticoccaceae bacterium]
MIPWDGALPPTAAAALWAGAAVLAGYLGWRGRRLARERAQLAAQMADRERHLAERASQLARARRLLVETEALLERERARHQAAAAALERSESYLAALLESLPLGLIAVTAKGRITLWNRKAESLTGVPAASALERDLWEVVATEVVTRERFERTLASGVPQRFRHEGPGKTYFEVTIHPLEAGEARAAILVEDVSQQVRAEQMVVQQEKVSAAGELAAGFAGDLAAPLAAILDDVAEIRAVLAQAAPQAAGSLAQSLERLARLLDDAADKGRWAAAVIDNLRAFAAGGDRRTVDPAELVDEALALARRTLAIPGRLAFRDLEVERHYDAERSPLHCHPEELKLVLLNLLRHALSALARWERRGERPRLEVLLADTHEGLWIEIRHPAPLDPGERARLFQPFHAEPRGERGPGERLSFSRFVVEDHHGGELTAETDPATGTCYRLRLPPSGEGDD